MMKKKGYANGGKMMKKGYANGGKVNTKGGAKGGKMKNRKIKMRGAGAATKGFYSRGPMA
jgi:hypothetical protein|tara:strand:- start:214 stop:393 length:180 start_codon:yes stop_codon:yes gene_type:complete